jgi:hypothetical protein
MTAKEKQPDARRLDQAHGDRRRQAGLPAGRHPRQAEERYDAMFDEQKLAA